MNFLILLSLLQITLIKSNILNFAVIPNYPATKCFGYSDQILTEGFEIQFTRDVFKQSGLTEGIDYQLTCEFDILQSIENGTFFNNSKYHGVIGGLEITGSKLNLGYFFSQPTYDIGYSILQIVQQPQSYLVKSFSFEALGIIICTIIIVSITFLMMETKNMFYNDYLYHSFQSFFNIKDQKLDLLQSRLIQIALWFLGFIFMSCIYSHIVLEIRHQNNQRLNSIEQLQGIKVYSNVQTEERLIKYNIQNQTIEWPQNISDYYQFMKDNNVEFAFMQNFKSKLISFANCGAHNIFQGFDKQEFGILYTQLMDINLIQAINVQILRLNQIKSSDQYLLEYISQKEKRCYNNLQYYRENNIMLQDLEIPFIFLLVAILIGFIWAFLKRKLRQKFPHWFLAIETTWVRRRRDLYITKRIRKYYVQKMADLCANLNSERNIRKKGIRLLKNYIQEKNYDNNQILAIFQSVETDEKPVYWQQENNSQMLMVQSQMYRSIMIKSGQNNDGMLRSQKYVTQPIEIDKKTPLTDYFQEKNGKIQNKFQVIYERKQSSNPTVYFKTKVKMGSKVANAFAQSHFFNDLLGNQLQNDNIDLIKTEELQGRFNLNILKMRKNYEQFLPKQDQTEAKIEDEPYSKNYDKIQNKSIKKVDIIDDEVQYEKVKTVNIEMEKIQIKPSKKSQEILYSEVSELQDENDNFFKQKNQKQFQNYNEIQVKSNKEEFKSELDNIDEDIDNTFQNVQKHDNTKVDLKYNIGKFLMDIGLQKQHMLKPMKRKKTKKVDSDDENFEKSRKIQEQQKDLENDSSRSKEVQDLSLGSLDSGKKNLLPAQVPKQPKNFLGIKIKDKINYQEDQDQDDSVFKPIKKNNQNISFSDSGDEK